MKHEEELASALDPSQHRAIEGAVQALSKKPLSVTRVGRALGLVTAQGEHVMIAPRGEGSIVSVRSISHRASSAIWTFVGLMLVGAVAMGLLAGATPGAMMVAPAVVMAAIAAYLRVSRARRARRIVSAVRARVEIADEPVDDAEEEVVEAAARSRRAR